MNTPLGMLFSGAQTNASVMTLRSQDRDHPGSRFGSHARGPRPLSFDRINDGHAVTSNYPPLKRLPLELLPHITDYLDAADLRSLALVDSDCRQLARSYQFATVELDYSPTGFDILAKLVDEGVKRISRFDFRSIGACVRRMVISTKSSQLEARHHIDTSKLDREEIPEDDEALAEVRLRHHEAALYYNNEYLPKLGFIFEHALIHLEVLEWLDVDITFSPALMQSIVHCPVQHLRLFRVSLSEEYEVPEPSASAARHWALKTLELAVHWNISDRRGGSTKPFCQSVLAQAAPTLEELHWEDNNFGLHPVPPHDVGQSILCFPHMRHLSFSDAEYDERSLKAFLQSGGASTVRSLKIDSYLMEHCQWLNDWGPIPSLKTIHLCVPRVRVPNLDGILPFLAANTQLGQFSMTYDTDLEFFETRLLPLLSPPSFALSSLKLAWNRPAIGPRSLELIGGMTSLRQLWLTAGEQSGWRFNWLIDHNAIREAFANLKLLERLVFNRDTYLNPLFNGPLEDYYNTYFYPPEVIHDLLDERELAGHGRQGSSQKFRKAVWERWHLSRMTTEAQLYVDQFENLEFILLGMRPMKVDYKVRRGQWRRTPIPMSRARDQCHVLKRYWGEYMA